MRSLSHLLAIITRNWRFQLNTAQTATGQSRYGMHRYNINSVLTQSCSGPQFFPKPPFFLFYNMKRSHVEKKSVLQAC